MGGYILRDGRFQPPAAWQATPHHLTIAKFLLPWIERRILMAR